MVLLFKLYNKCTLKALLTPEASATSALSWPSSTGLWEGESQGEDDTDCESGAKLHLCQSLMGNWWKASFCCHFLLKQNQYCENIFWWHHKLAHPVQVALLLWHIHVYCLLISWFNDIFCRLVSSPSVFTTQLSQSKIVHGSLIYFLTSFDGHRIGWRIHPFHNSPSSDQCKISQKRLWSENNIIETDNSSDTAQPMF